MKHFFREMKMYILLLIITCFGQSVIPMASFTTHQPSIPVTPFVMVTSSKNFRQTFSHMTSSKRNSRQPFMLISPKLNVTRTLPSDQMNDETNASTGSHVLSDTITLKADDSTTMETFLVAESFVRRVYDPIVNLLGLLSCITTLVVLRSDMLKSSATVYIRGIASANLLSILTAIVPILHKYEAISASRSWLNFYSYYVAYLFPFNFIFMAANAWIVTAFGVERLIAVYRPIRAHLISNESRAKKVVVCMFIMSFLTNLTRFFSITVKTKVGPATNDTMHEWHYTKFGNDKLHIRVEYLFYAIAVVIVPVILVVVVNILVVLKIRVAQKIQQTLKARTSIGKSNYKVQVERVLIANLSVFIICNILVATTVTTVAVHGLGIFRKPILEFRTRVLVSTMLYALNPLLNFILYVFCCKSLRDAVKSQFCGRICSMDKHVRSSVRKSSAKPPTVTERV